MKYLVVVLEGAVSDAESGKTPLERATMPECDRLARRGQVGAVRLLPPDVRLPGEAALLALLGYDPGRYTGRGPVLAAALRVNLAPGDVAFCCPLIVTDGTTILSGVVQPVSDDEVFPLMQMVAERLGTRRLSFYPAPQNRSVLTFAEGPTALATTPPARLAGRTLKESFPQGDEADRLTGLIYDSLELLVDHPINRRRVEEGQLPLNTIWPYGQGGPLAVRPFFTRFAREGAVISGDLLVQGIARTVGLSVATPPAPVNAALVAATREALRTGWDFLLLPVLLAATNETPGADELQERIERADRELIEPLVHHLERGDDPFRLLVVATSPADLSRTVPFLLYDAEGERQNSLPFDERAVTETRLVVEEGHRLLQTLFR